MPSGPVSNISMDSRSLSGTPWRPGPRRPKVRAEHRSSKTYVSNDLSMLGYDLTSWRRRERAFRKNSASQLADPLCLSEYKSKEQAPVKIVPFKYPHVRVNVSHRVLREFKSDLSYSELCHHTTHFRLCKVSRNFFFGLGLAAWRPYPLSVPSPCLALPQSSRP